MFIRALLAVYVMIAAAYGPYGPEKLDFSAEDGAHDWQPLNDGVMGGMSEGDMTLTENSMRFDGAVSLENNGGFASVKSPFGINDLSEFTAIRVRYKATGQTFAVTLETDRQWFRPYYKQSLQPGNGEWEEVELPLTEFKEYSIGQATGAMLSEAQRAKVLRMGIISNEKKAGPFSLEVDYIEFVR